MAFIYTISGEGKIYVGKTTHRWPRCRFTEHKRLANKGIKKTPLYRWLGTDPDVTFTVIDEAPKDKIDSLERYYIREARRGPLDCVNVCEGGEGGFHHMTSEQRKLRAERSAAAKRGTKHSEETKRKMSETRKGRSRPDISESNRRRPCPDMTAAHAAKKKSPKVQAHVKRMTEYREAKRRDPSLTWELFKENANG